jgi:FeS assembly SUF system protein
MDLDAERRPDPALQQKVIEILRTVYDPEIPVNIYDLGMIYGIDVKEDNFVHVTMTLTSPACPVAGILPGQVEEKVKSVPGVSGGKVELVWEPPWSPDKMSEAARLELGMM